MIIDRTQVSDSCVKAAGSGRKDVFKSVHFLLARSDFILIIVDVSQKEEILDNY